MSLDALTGLIPVAIGAGIVMKITERTLGPTSPQKKRSKQNMMGIYGVAKKARTRVKGAKVGFGTPSKLGGKAGKDPFKGYGPKNIGKPGGKLTKAQRKYANLG